MTNVLEAVMFDNDANAHTIKEYLLELLTLVWIQGEGFNGKRPFGNSGWQDDLYKALIASGEVPGTIDEYGDIVDIDQDLADELIINAILSL